MLLVLMGLLMIFDTTSAEVLDRSLDANIYFACLKQLGYVILSLVIGVAIYKTGYEKLIAFSPVFYAVILTMLVLVLVPHVGMELNGARRWLAIGPLSFQPSELMKFILPFFFLYTEKKDWRWRMVFLAAPIFLVLVEPDNGCGAIMIALMVVLCFLTRVPWLYWALPLLVTLCLGGAIASQHPHVNDRIRIYLNPELDLLGKGHQPFQAKIAAGSGGLLGRGVGESLQKLNYLPEARSDYIAAIFAEEFGFLGMFFLILIYMGIIYLGFNLASRSSTREGYVLATSLTFLLGLQAFLNLGVVCGLLPSKGTNLPFFSHGGSNFLANAMILCAILTVGRRWTKSF
ncbi:MAG: cell division protein FtsW [Simkaniaceae bacterium]|nr:cell division protein FtsW [Simkaniaceae bacterium]